MPPKRASMARKNYVKESQKIQMAFRRQSEALNTTKQPSFEEQILLLQNEKTKLLSRLNELKKEVTDVHRKKRDLEFSMLQDSTRQLETFTEYKPLVEAWSKYNGINITEVLFNSEEESREWLIKGEIEEEKFSLQILCMTQDTTHKGYVDNFSIECSEQSQLELQTWLSNNPGNIQRIIAMLKAYYNMSKKRRTGIETCEKEFGSIIAVSSDNTGETIIDIGTEDACYFQIKWKLVPISRHFAKVKNYCRISCTEDGDAIMKANADLATVRKRLNQNTIEVIRLLAGSITKQHPAVKKRQANKTTRK